MRFRLGSGGSGERLSGWWSGGLETKGGCDREAKGEGYPYSIN